MLNLPKECRVDRFLPKRTFYEHVGITSTTKKEFVDDVDKMTWLYKLSEDNIHVSKTKQVEEIEIFQIEMKNKIIPNNVIKAIVKGIPYKILFKITYKEDYCYAINPNENIYYTEWNEDINIDFEGLNLESIYDRIIKQIIKEETNQKSIEDILIDRAKIDDLNKKINQLTQKVKSENQFDRKVALNCELNKLKKEMEELNNG